MLLQIMHSNSCKGSWDLQHVFLCAKQANKQSSKPTRKETTILWVCPVRGSCLKFHAVAFFDVLKKTCVLQCLEVFAAIRFMVRSLYRDKPSEKDSLFFSQRKRLSFWLWVKKIEMWNIFPKHVLDLGSWMFVDGLWGWSIRNLLALARTR